MEDKGNSIKIHNRTTMQRFLKFCEMTECKPAKTPLQSGLDLCMDESDDLNDETPYRQLIGLLLRFPCTIRPDKS